MQPNGEGVPGGSQIVPETILNHGALQSFAIYTLRTVCLCLFGQGETPSALAILNVLLILIYWNDFTDTLPKTKIVPENEWLEDKKILLGRPIFRVCVLQQFQGGYLCFQTGPSGIFGIAVQDLVSHHLQKLFIANGARAIIIHILRCGNLKYAEIPPGITYLNQKDFVV